MGKINRENSDEDWLYKDYILKAKLAELQKLKGYPDVASKLYSEAAEAAMNDGKMQLASEWSALAS